MLRNRYVVWRKAWEATSKPRRSAARKKLPRPTSPSAFQPRTSKMRKLKFALRNGLDALADYATTMAAILFYVPVILAWSITILFAGVVAWRALRWTGRRFFDWHAAAPQKAANPA